MKASTTAPMQMQTRAEGPAVEADNESAQKSTESGGAAIQEAKDSEDSETGPSTKAHRHAEDRRSGQGLRHRVRAIMTLRRGRADPDSASKHRMRERDESGDESATASTTAPIQPRTAIEDTATKADDESTEESTAGQDAIIEETKDAEDPEPEAKESAKPRTRISWSRVLALGLLPALTMLLAATAAFLKWQDSSSRESAVARIESVQAARDSTTALLSYRPDTADRDLGAARDRLTGSFRDSYTSLTHDVVIPGAKQKQISAVATVPAAASVSATPNHAVVLVFVNQTVIVGQDAPTATASSVRVTLDKVGGRWLISQFDPI